jgi:hypothetical protein
LDINGIGVRPFTRMTEVQRNAPDWFYGLQSFWLTKRKMSQNSSSFDVERLKGLQHARNGK